jgi:hypothetical protein
MKSLDIASSKRRAKNSRTVFSNLDVVSFYRRVFGNDEKYAIQNEPPDDRVRYQYFVTILCYSHLSLVLSLHQGR